MADSRHIIRRQTIEVALSARGGNHFQLSEQVSRLAHGVVARAIERALESVDLPDRTIRLDRLDITLECSDIALLEQTINQQLEQKLTQQLTTHITAATQQTALNRAEILAASQTDAEIVLYFLQHGYLPWFAPAGITLAELEYRFSEALAQHGSFAVQLMDLLAHKTVLQRLLRQFSAAMPWRILTAQRVSPPEPVRKRMQRFIRQQNVAIQSLFWAKMYAHPDAVIALFQNKKAAVSVHALDKLPALQTLETPPDKAVNPEGMYVQQAGLVLLHPFIAGLFDALHWRDGKQITDPFRAVFALHFAASGQTQAAEWELILPKLLCGIALDEPFPTTAILTEAEQKEIEHLLETVIEHWGALGNTSAQGLREGFLQRDGKLVHEGDRWLLSVEQKAQDILLGQLPWGMSMIKLPWMEDLLVTEWTG